LLILLNFSCAKSPGTDTGNPAHDPDAQCGGLTRCMPNPWVLELVHYINKKIGSCQDLPDDGSYNVLNLIYQQPGLNLELPIFEANLFEAEKSYNTKNLLASKSSFSNCVDVIEKMACDSSIFTAAFDVSNPNDFSNIHKIFRADSSCQSMFKDKE
jgi:hypothetical protein